MIILRIQSIILRQFNRTHQNFNTNTNSNWNNTCINSWDSDRQYTYGKLVREEKSYRPAGFGCLWGNLMRGTRFINWAPPISSLLLLLETTTLPMRVLSARQYDNAHDQDKLPTYYIRPTINWVYHPGPVIFRFHKATLTCVLLFDRVSWQSVSPTWSSRFHLLSWSPMD